LYDMEAFCCDVAQTVENFKLPPTTSMEKKNITCHMSALLVILIIISKQY